MLTKYYYNYRQLSSVKRLTEGHESLIPPPHRPMHLLRQGRRNHRWVLPGCRHSSAHTNRGPHVRGRSHGWLPWRCATGDSSLEELLTKRRRQCPTTTHHFHCGPKTPPRPVERRARCTTRWLGAPSTSPHSQRAWCTDGRETGASAAASSFLAATLEEGTILVEVRELLARRRLGVEVQRVHAGAGNGSVGRVGRRRLRRPNVAGGERNGILGEEIKAVGVHLRADPVQGDASTTDLMAGNAGGVSHRRGCLLVDLKEGPHDSRRRAR